MCTAAAMKIDLILPPGRHSWNLDEGWAYTLKEMGLLGEARQARSDQVDETLEWIAHSSSNMIVLMGGDHHLHFLHDTPKKRQRWATLKMPTVCFCYESIQDSRFPGSKEKSESAVDTFSHFVYCDEKDSVFFESRGVASAWLQQCVDHKHFHPPRPGIPRQPLVFFRGKLDENFGYGLRREIQIGRASCRERV